MYEQTVITGMCLCTGMRISIQDSFAIGVQLTHKLYLGQQSRFKIFFMELYSQIAKIAAFLMAKIAALCSHSVFTGEYEVNKASFNEILPCFSAPSCYDYDSVSTCKTELLRKVRIINV